MLAPKSSEDQIFVCLISVLFIVFNQNLGLMPLLADEPTRALVSLEMLLRNNYIFPTLGNEAYLNKPPLFNWILAGVMYLIKDYKEWHLRFISILPLFIIAIAHYIIISKEVSKKIALWSSIAFLTCGRILFYDSMVAYIDPLFSLFIVLNTYWIIIQSKNTLSLRFFVISYILCLLAFFLKGLPALSFQACTLLAICIYRKKFTQLISFNHFAGIATFLIFTAIYYYEYGEYANTSTLFTNILSQSSQRTPLETDTIDSLLHLVMFPVEFILTFFPFSFFILFAFRKNMLTILKQNEFLFLSFLFICSNIWLYWISSETRARYLFMFLPMFFTIIFYFYEKYKSSLSTQLIKWAVLIFSIALAGALIAIPILQRFSFIEFKELKAIGLLLLVLLVILAVYRYKLSKVISIILLLIIARITFNFYILPLRKNEAQETINKTIGTEIGAITKNDPLVILNGAPVNHDILYYLTKERNSLVQQNYLKLPPKKILKSPTKTVVFHIDSIPKRQIIKIVNDTLIVSDSTISDIQRQIRNYKVLHRKSLKKGYYICFQSDTANYKLKPVLTFDVSHNGLTLVLAKK